MGVTIVESLVDWISCSAQVGSRADHLENLALSLIRVEEGLGAKLRSFDKHGYHGESAGRAHFGRGETGVIVSLVGYQAEVGFVQAMRFADRVSRIDIACTTRHNPADGQVAKRAAGQYDVHRTGKRHQPRARLEDGMGDGDTFYLGATSSDRQLRVYDKDKESKEAQYRNCWRTELQCRRDVAASLAASLGRAPDRQRYIADSLHNELVTRGIRPWFGNATDDVSNKHFRRRADADTKLTWLGKQVRPSIGWLLEAGYAREIVDALGEDVILSVLEERGRWPAKGA